MNPVNQKTIDLFNETAQVGARRVREALQTSSSDKSLKRGKLGAMAMTAYVRILATENNRVRIERQLHKK